MVKRYDIYVGQARSNGRLDILRHHVHRGFSYWMFEEIQTYWKEEIREDAADDERALHRHIPVSKRQSQMARRRFIEQQEAGGHTVKGVSYINMGLVNDLNRERFKISSEPVKTIEELNRLWKAEEFLSVRDDVYGPKEYEQLPLFDLKKAMEEEKVFQAFSKEELCEQNSS